MSEENLEVQVKTALAKLTEYYYDRSDIALKKQGELDKIIPEDVKAKIAEIESKYRELESENKMLIEKQESFVKEYAILLGRSVKGGLLQAVWVKGRVTWDTTILDAISEYNSAVKMARKEGNPSISIKYTK